MSEKGHSRRFDDVRITSAFHPIATVERTSQHVGVVLWADIATGVSR
jgi:hypothetical protein